MMGWFALLAAALGLVSVALPSPGMFVAMGLGLAATATGLAGYRSRFDSGPARLAGAGAVALGLLAAALAFAKYGLTLASFVRLEALFT